MLLAAFVELTDRHMHEHDRQRARLVFEREASRVSLAEATRLLRSIDFRLANHQGHEGGLQIARDIISSRITREDTHHASHELV